jgi:hypothetical protein
MEDGQMTGEDRTKDLRRLIDIAGHPGPQTLHKILVELMESRKRIQRKLSGEPSSEYARWNLGHLLAATERAIRRIDSKLGIDSGIRQSPSGSAGLLVISEAALVVAHHLEPRLPVQVSAEGKQRIWDVLRRSCLGGAQVHEIIAEIREVLESEGLDDPDALAASIFRNETSSRVAIANQASLSASCVPGLQKEWRASPNCPIEAHHALDGQRVDVDETFDVQGEKIMFPHDPSAPLENTSGCTCTSTAWVPGWERFGLDRQRNKL